MATQRQFQVPVELGVESGFQHRLQSGCELGVQGRVEPGFQGRIQTGGESRSQKAVQSLIESRGIGMDIVSDPAESRPRVQCRPGLSAVAFRLAQQEPGVEDERALALFVHQQRVDVDFVELRVLGDELGQSLQALLDLGHVARLLAAEALQ